MRTSKTLHSVLEIFLKCLIKDANIFEQHPEHCTLQMKTYSRRNKGPIHNVSIVLLYLYMLVSVHSNFWKTDRSLY